ncbi:MAG: hypothetical protein LBN95_00380 [Prevotellaceae bacterium]|jgi:hypothetical protein|nr:hypothetical protein [Prevotellaceae bacterium]
MKNLILIIGSLLIVLNTLIGLIITDYAVLNFLLANISIAISTAIIYFVAISKIADGFKIGLTAFCFFAGIARCLCVAFAPSVLKDNALLLVVLGLLFFEVICVATAKILSKK